MPAKKVPLFDDLSQEAFVELVNKLSCAFGFEETTRTAIAACQAAWEFFGGVFKVLVVDNTKSIVQTADPLSPRITAAFSRRAGANAAASSGSWPASRGAAARRRCSDQRDRRP